MCLDHHITIDEELGEKMTLPKDHPDAKYRLRLLEKLGECAFKQGSYHLATKKFTQAGNRVKVGFYVELTKTHSFRLFFFLLTPMQYTRL